MDLELLNEFIHTLPENCLGGFYPSLKNEHSTQIPLAEEITVYDFIYIKNE